MSAATTVTATYRFAGSRRNQSEFTIDGISNVTSNGTQASPYPDYPIGQGGYEYINPPLATDRPGISDGFGNSVVDINRWQRLYIVNAVDQNGFPISGPIQNYLGAQWLGVRAFSLTRTDPTKPWIDLRPPPLLNGLGD